MAEGTKPGSGRARRSTRVSRRLAEARRRNAEQLARQREQEQRVEDALTVFFDAGDRRVAAEEECQRRVEPHERAIARLREQRDVVVATLEATQARAALTIHEADRTVEQVAELLEMGEKAARRLIAAGREAAARDRTARQDTATGHRTEPHSKPDPETSWRETASAPNTPLEAQAWPAESPGRQVDSDATE